jgi:hypothetical protein
MNSSLRSILKARRVAAVALAIAAVPFTAGTASAAASTPVSSVHAIGGYVFYNVTYLEAVDLYFAAVAAAPAGYTPPPVTSVSATTTVSGTVDPAR